MYARPLFVVVGIFGLFWPVFGTPGLELCLELYLGFP